MVLLIQKHKQSMLLISNTLILKQKFAIFLGIQGVWKNSLSPSASPRVTDHFSDPLNPSSQKVPPVTLVISHYLYIIIPLYANKVDCAILLVKSKE